MGDMGENTVISPALLAAALEELDAGVRMTVQQSCNMFRARRMSPDDLLSLLRSFAWQSPTLKAWFRETEEDSLNNRRQVVHGEAEMLSLGDIRSLMDVDSEAPLKKSRLHESRVDAINMPTFGTPSSGHNGDLPNSSKAQESSVSSVMPSHEDEDASDLPSAVRPQQGEDSAGRQARGMRKKSVSWTQFDKLSIAAPSHEEYDWDAEEARAAGLSCSASGPGEPPRCKSENYQETSPQEGHRFAAYGVGADKPYCKGHKWPEPCHHGGLGTPLQCVSKGG
jgi:hypothetical protein